MNEIICPIQLYFQVFYFFSFAVVAPTPHLQFPLSFCVVFGQNGIESFLDYRKATLGILSRDWDINRWSQQDRRSRGKPITVNFKYKFSASTINTVTAQKTFSCIQRWSLDTDWYLLYFCPYRIYRRIVHFSSLKWFSKTYPMATWRKCQRCPRHDLRALMSSFSLHFRDNVLL